MQLRIVTALGQLKQDLAGQLDRPAILDACRAAGHTWRDCPLEPVAILHLSLLQVLHGINPATKLIRAYGDLAVSRETLIVI
jgi:hypothetical protein